MIKDFIEKVIKFENLDRRSAHEVMNLIIEGQVNDCQVASFLTALQMKGETPEEITGFAQAMLEKAEIVKTARKNVVDTCGTGGDARNTFNISTAASIIAAGAGVTVLKHGNRSVSSRCGSADVFEALGVNINLCAGDVSRCIDKTGIGFIFAQVAHPAMRNVARARKEMRIKTVFNILGPILNPATARARVMGVYSMKLLPLMVEALKGIGVKRALVVCSKDGLDELSIFSENYIQELNEGKISQYILDPAELGFTAKGTLKEVEGKSPKENAEIILDILTKRDRGARRAIAVLNASAAILVSGMVKDFHKALAAAEDSIDSKKALNKLNELVDFTKKCN